MSEAEYMTDGADYLNYYGQDCNMKCSECSFYDECDEIFKDRKEVK